ncbi:hypothetical protein [Burkholderia stagnalis]|uniref:Uncharacterized protein n=1 Tax=Burkholderia stagnalis TaxID=1503054 RepID=A0A6L3N1P5_9BURK|nr:hypothetical protein [Burkholderia stagnalis]KAB0639903.1 hypothetical protein F7R25_06195 [Burkholderia stagnalis]VWB61617.1 hypothetical protein BST28156_02897 [Burkholderia stagnalis]
MTKTSILRGFLGISLVDPYVMFTALPRQCRLQTHSGHVADQCLSALPTMATQYADSLCALRHGASVIGVSSCIIDGIHRLVHFDNSKMLSMTKRYLVLDQNILRKAELSDMLANQQEAHFVLPDLAFLELTKNDKWKETLRGSLAILAEAPVRVHIAYSVNESLKKELETLQPQTGHLMYHEATEFVRDLLCWVRTGVETVAFRRIKEGADHRLAVASDHLSHDANRGQLAGLIEVTKNMVTREQQKLLRSKQLSEGERLSIILDHAKILSVGILQGRGVDKRRAISFIKRRPLVFRYILLNVWHCMRWIAEGGFEGFPAEKVSNDVLDQQYVLTATSFHGLVSNDTRVKHAYSDLTKLLGMKI